TTHKQVSLTEKPVAPGPGDSSTNKAGKSGPRSIYKAYVLERTQIKPFPGATPHSLLCPPLSCSSDDIQDEKKPADGAKV
ncbi:unnamed protein product, partial [Rangifer tarandus platyrhynchus]